MVGLSLSLLFYVGASAQNNIITDEEYHRFPPLFHLDDYARCLSQSNGLYCLGIFQLQPALQHHPTFELMKEYSKKDFAFNHTLLHRGYCVSERCPSSERNATLRFEQCVNEQIDSLTARLLTTHYCKTQQQHREKTTQGWDLLRYAFLMLGCFIVFLNVAGTVYDVYAGFGLDLMPQLKYWSIKSSFHKLFSTSNDNDSTLEALSPIHGYRALSVIIVLFVHAIYGRYKQYAYSDYIEKFADSCVIEVLKSGTSLLHVFVLISSFLTGYSLLMYSKNNKLSFKLLPICVLKRAIRVSPLYLFMIGYSATWWPRHGDGPVWSLQVETRSNVCRDKFWLHAFYLHNLVRLDTNNYCMEPTWFLAADMQTNIAVCALTIWLARLGRKALAVHAVFFAISCSLTTVVAYMAGWRSWLYTANPESIRTSFADDPSFVHVYMSSWILLPACFLGLFGAHLHFELQKQNVVDITQFKWAMKLYSAFFYLFLPYLITGVFLKKYTSPIATSLIIGFHRPIFVLISAYNIFMSFYIKNSSLRTLFSWKGWHIPSRLSLPVLLINWMLLISFAGSKTYATTTTWFNAVEDWIVLTVLSYVIAIPMAVLIEIPAQRFLTALFLGTKQKKN